MVTAISENKQFRAVVVRVTNLVQEAKDRHTLNPVTSVIMGELLMGALLSASALKGEERVILKLEVAGPLQYAVGEATANGEVRGYTSCSDAIVDGIESKEREEILKQTMGPGLLHVTRILHREVRPVTGTVDLKKSRLAHDLAWYFTMSDQIPSALRLEVGQDCQFNIAYAVGVIVQALPDADEKSAAKIEETMAAIADLAPFADDTQGDEQLLNTIFQDLNFTEIARKPVDFFCRCSKKRFAHALRLLHEDELREMSGEQQNMVCHFCNESYDFTGEEIRKIMIEKNLKVNN